MHIVASALRASGHDVRIVADDGVDTLFAGESTQSLVTPRRMDGVFVSIHHPRQFRFIAPTLARLGLSPMRDSRSPSDPLVVFGGRAMSAPEPVADFADIVALGDGEVTATRIAALLGARASKTDIARELECEPGYYVTARGPHPVTAAYMPRFEPAAVEWRDKAVPIVELARGCRSKCSYCAIGWASGEYRETPADVVQHRIEQLRTARRVNLFAPDAAAVSTVVHLPPWMADTSEDARVDSWRDPRRIAAAHGIDGLSQRIRRAVGKPCSNDDFAQAIGRYAPDVRLKIYCILGYPTEDDADASEFVALLTEMRRTRKHANISLMQLHAMPHTPLQWASGLYDDAAAARHMAIHEDCSAAWKAGGARFLVYNYTSRDTYEADSWCYRADRRAASVLATWRPSRWRDDAAAVGLAVEDICRAREIGSPMPWDRIDLGGPPRRAAEAAARATMRRLGSSTPPDPTA